MRSAPWDSEKNHGSHARIGDYVQLLDPRGYQVAVYGMVYKVDTDDAWGNRYLHIYGQLHRVRDHLVRIVSRGSN